MDGEKNMNKYDKMLELNKRKSEEKVERAVLTIRTMILEREKVSGTSTDAKDRAVQRILL